MIQCKSGAFVWVPQRREFKGSSKVEKCDIWTQRSFWHQLACVCNAHVSVCARARAPCWCRSLILSALRQTAPAAEMTKKDMMQWSHSSSLWAISRVSVCQADIDMCVCLGLGRLAVSMQLQPLCLLPHSSHKVNCWNDLYLHKHLRHILSHGESHRVQLR